VSGGGASGSKSSKSVFLSATLPFNFWKFKDESSDSSFLRVANSWRISKHIFKKNK
jgi:hypothetical protein